MRIKSLGLQMIPYWCIHSMGNHVCCVHLRAEETSGVETTTVKLIKSDGVVKIYHRPIIASELMLQFPKHLICHSDSFYIGQKVPPLSENDQLQLGHKYFLLPKHFFQSVLSFVTIASFASSPPSSSSRSSRNEFLKKVGSCQPFDIRKTPSGSLQIRISDDFISKLIEEGKIKEEEAENSSEPKGRVCTTAQLQKDYKQLVRSRKWRPKLETIRESGKRRKLDSFVIYKRRSKSQRRETDKAYSTSAPLPTSSSKEKHKMKELQ